MTKKGGTISSNGHTGVTACSGATARCDPQQNSRWMENDFSGPCTVRDILDRIGDKWSVLVVLRLGTSQSRFRALLRAVDGISPRMLTVTLRGLERDGLVWRKVFDTRPPSVEYGLMPLGQSLLGYIGALASWAVDNEAKIKATRARFDGLGR